MARQALLPSTASLLLLWSLLSAALFGALPAAAREPGFTERYCVRPPYDRLCATLPFDQADFSSSFEYRVLVKGAQDPFDVFAWQAFVALNWPAGEGGAPLPVGLGEAARAPRVWQDFARRDSVFGPDPAAVCADRLPPAGLLIGDFEQADGTVLIDRDRDFVVYDTRLNGVAADYIRDNGLQSLAGQAAFRSDRAVSFPLGRLPDVSEGDPGARPSVLIKTAWRILGEDAAAGRYLLRDAVIHVPAAGSATGATLCLSLRLGLVGMHIVLRTHSGNGDEWIWATFEHIDNAPLAGNARDVNSLYAKELFPDGCTSPETRPGDRFSFFDPDCEDCRPNQPLPGSWTWAARAPHARLAGRPAPRGTQVVRCWAIFESTAEVNRLWQRKLSSTPLANYMAVSTQWRGANKSPLFEHGEVPRYLANTTMETYLQDNPKGSCMGCHAEATTATGRDSNFTYLLRRATAQTATARAATALPATALPATEQAETCSLTFDVVAQGAIGGIAPDERLRGRADFTVRSSLRQDAETLSYATTGRLRVELPGRGAVAGDIRVVHVVRAPHTADYISIDAARVSGNLGGVRAFFDPMLVTLYAPPGSLAESGLPRDEADWSLPFGRKVFQVHSPTATEAFFGRVESLSGRCR